MSAARVAVPAAWLVLASGCSMFSSKHPGEALPYFSKVDDRLYRGAHPSAAGFRQLADMGVKTIINLRAEDPLWQQQGRRVAMSYGIDWVYLPMWVFWRPSDRQVRTFLEIVMDPGRSPVFLHCRQGEDRTGALVAVYRIVGQGWEPQRAYSEARSMGMGGWNPLLRRLILRDAREQYAPMFPPRSAPPPEAR